MAPVLGQFGRTVFSNFAKGYSHPKVYLSNTSSSFREMSQGKKILLTTGCFLTTAAAGLAYSLNESVKAIDLNLHPPKYPWPHKGHRHEPELLAALPFRKLELDKAIGLYDAASLRRGWQVYKQVCAACHSLRFVAYRQFVDLFMTEDEAKAEAAEATITDGPDANGKMFQRPGKLADYIPSPYPNEEAARVANGGAYPPDLSNITVGREGDEDYVFSLLRGYADPPAGVELGENQHFNLYMQGNAIAMAQALYNGLIEYDDGTPATASQMAKDVTHFLAYCATPELESWKKYLFKWTIISTCLFGLAWYYKRHLWASLVYRRVAYRDVNKKH
ncbi:cytochrome c1-2, heme protein, mitochondrial [Tetranychus urticae]|uniref:Cytochrome c domain-containing protein n=1 Tax=Tetranychus urticae TaxID=32264 RepID=T1K310_TETUR|nr:cytochrome c1-2, heme protein, mitochondrial [Tetranychus urticae]